MEKYMDAKYMDVETINLDYILEHRKFLIDSSNRINPKQRFLNLIAMFYQYNPLQSDEHIYKQHNGWLYLGQSSFRDLHVSADSLTNNILYNIDECCEFEFKKYIDEERVNKSLNLVSTQIPEMVDIYVGTFGSKGLLITKPEDDILPLIYFYVRARVGREYNY